MNKIFYSIIAFFLIFYTTYSNSDFFPENIGNNNKCIKEANILMNIPGPKAQIITKKGKKLFLCNVKELFILMMDEKFAKKIYNIYVQDFSKMQWDAYQGNWIKVNDATFVIDSNLKSNDNYIPFRDKKEAEKFCKENGGKVISFSDLYWTYYIKKCNDEI